MNKMELQQRLEESKVPKDLYKLSGGLPNEAFCLNEEDGVWEVYYSERGVKSQLRRFHSEAEACEYLYRTILETLS